MNSNVVERLTDRYVGRLAIVPTTITTTTTTPTTTTTTTTTTTQHQHNTTITTTTTTARHRHRHTILGTCTVPLLKVTVVDLTNSLGFFCAEVLGVYVSISAGFWRIFSMSL